MTIQESLIGKEIKKFILEKDGSEITFQLKDGTTVRLLAEGDCCSNSWIENIDNEDALKGKVTAVEDIDMPFLGHIPTAKHNPVQFIKYYGLKITTENGEAILDYRNDSNGYYGGNLLLYAKHK